MPRKSVRVLVVAIALVVCALLVHRGRMSIELTHAQRGVETSHTLAGQDLVKHNRLLAAAWDQDGRANRVQSEKAEEQKLARSALSSAVAPGSKWFRTFPRRRFDVVDYILSAPDKVDASYLVRHPDLNLRDTPVPREEWEAFSQVCQAHKAAFSEVMQHFREMQLKEMGAVVDAGLVGPSALPALPEEKLRKIATRVAGSEAAKKAGITADALVEGTRRAGVPESNGASYLLSKGKAYLHRDFPSLESDRLHTEIAVLGMQFLADVGAWFEIRNLTTHQKVTEMIVAGGQWNGERSRRGAQASGR